MASSTVCAFSIALTAPPSRQCGWQQLGVARAPLDRDRRVDGAAAGDPDVEAGGLRDDARVGAHAVRHAGDPAGAGRLLVGDRVHEQVARQADAERGERLGCQHHRCDAALHVAGAAAVELSVAHHRGVRIARPALLGLARDDVDVAVEQQAAPAARACEARQQLRAPVEVEVEGHLPAEDVLGPGLPDLDCGTRRRQALRQVGLQRGLVARRIARVARRRVEADESRGELDELVAARGDRLGDALLGVVHPLHSSAGAGLRRHSRSCTSTRKAAPLPSGSLSASSHRRSAAWRGRAALSSRGAVRQQPLRLGRVERRAQALGLSGAAQRAEVDVDRDVLRARGGQGIASGHAAEVGAQAGDGALVAAGAGLAVVEGDERAALERTGQDSLQLGLCRRDVVFAARDRRGRRRPGADRPDDLPAGRASSRSARRRRSRRAARRASAGDAPGRRRAPRWR